MYFASLEEKNDNTFTPKEGVIPYGIYKNIENLSLRSIPRANTLIHIFISSITPRPMVKSTYRLAAIQSVI